MTFYGSPDEEAAMQQQLPRKRRIWPWVILGLFVALLCGFGGVALIGSAGDKTNGAPTNTPSPTPNPGPSGGVAKKVAKAVAPTIGEGAWKVGTDVKPGKYSTVGAADSVIPLCYWDVRAGSETGDITAQGVSNKATAKGYVTLKSGEYFKTSGCKPWTKL